MKRMPFALACLAGLALVGTGLAQVEADPNKEYAITPEAGPWMIYATHFVGPDARQLAHEMVLEIRSRYNLPAWVFDRGEEERQKEQQRLRELREKYQGYQGPLRTTRIQDQVAVLVGGYKDFDAASGALKSIKALPPPVSDRLKPQVVVIKPGEDGQQEQVYKDYVNPFLNSFATRNPTVPVEHRAEKKSDPFIKQLNANESFSLLKCKGRYSLVIAAYPGASTYVSGSTPSSFLDKLRGKPAGTALEAGALNAHNFAEVLRKRPLEFEAYVLHLRGGSLVTIGSFDRQDDPRMQVLQRQLASHVQIQGQVQMVPEPFPIEVPR
jgi:hypothetical protein